MATAKKKVEKKFYASDVNMNLIKACIAANSPTLMVGETGTGKTTIIRELAKEEKKNLVRISVNGSMGVEEILGKWLVESGTTKWQDGILTDAMKKGHWVVMDEINAALPEILFTLHSLLDDDRSIVLPEKDNEVIKPHKDFRFFATMNPPEEYAGTKDMNKALMSRFTAVLNVKVLSEAEEGTLLEEKGADTKVAQKLVEIATYLRAQKVEDNIFYYCSTRDLVQVVELVAGGVSVEEAIEGAIINKMTPDEYKEVSKKMDTLVGKPVSNLPTRTIGELVELVRDTEATIKKEIDAMSAKHNEELDKVRKEAEEKAGDKVSEDFINKLTELSRKS